MTLTEELLTAGLSERGGYSRRQLDLLGVAWPPLRGWKKTVVGKDFPDAVVKEFLRLSDRPFDAPR